MVGEVDLEPSLERNRLAILCKTSRQLNLGEQGNLKEDLRYEVGRHQSTLLYRRDSVLVRR